MRHNMTHQLCRQPSSVFSIFLCVLACTTVLPRSSYAEFSPEYGVSASGDVGLLSTTYYANIIAAVTQPLYCRGVNPIPVFISNACVESAVILTTAVTVNPNCSTAWITALITILPRDFCVNVSGTYGIQFYFGCIGDDPDCEDYIQTSPSFVGYVNLYIPDGAAQTSETVEISLTARTYDENGGVDTSFEAGQTVIIEEVITTDGGNPTNNCTCTTEMCVYDWSGVLLGNYTLETDALFHPKSLLLSPLENKFSIYLDPSAFSATNGEFVQINAICDVNWELEENTKKATISRTQNFVGDHPPETRLRYSGSAITTSCTYEEYGTLSALERSITIQSHDNLITVTVVDYGLGSLMFPNGQNGTMCEYSIDNHNGWVVTSSETNGCVQTTARDFDADLFRVNCAQMLNTANGYDVDTTVEEYTMPLYSGTLFDTILTVVVDAYFYDKMYLPSSTETEYIEVTIYDPPAYGAVVSGTGTMGENDYVNLLAQINAPYCITSMNPIPLSVPDNTLGAVLLVTSITKALHSWSEITVLLTIYPESDDCEIYGYFVLEFFVGCLPEDPSCDDDVLQDFQSFTAEIIIGIPGCMYQGQNATLSIRTYDQDGSFAVYLQPGQTIIIDERSTTYAGIPEEDCDCTTYVFLYDWSGNLLEHHNVETEAELFHATSLLVSPLENKFSIYLDPSIFRCAVALINATCVINWGNGQPAQAFSSYATITVGTDDISGENSDDYDNTDIIIIVVIVGLVVTAGVVALSVVLFLTYKWRGKSRHQLLKEKQPLYNLTSPCDTNENSLL
ncbi:hypothetical protein Pelo_6188 [Pelomyxa schiedti]|nr:hypothetical protein Pelo_6188 [Pelomyxa schiedti]